MEVAAYRFVMMSRPLTWVLVWCAVGLAWPVVAAESGAPPAEPTQRPAEMTTSAPKSQPPTRVIPVLPDDGPRREPWVSEEQMESLRTAREAFVNEQWDPAIWMFGRAEEQLGDTGLAPMARAYRAEALVRRAATAQDRQEAIELYQSLIRDYPQSANASRAGWRVGDLFSQQGWKVEAQAAYERAAKAAMNAQDKTRAFLGMGLMYVENKKWKEALHTLKALRGVELDDVSRGWMTVGLAESLYQLGRRTESAEYFRALTERWPHRLREGADLLLHASEIEQSAGRHEDARRTRLLFYNLYPSHPDAPMAMVTVGDSLRKSGRLAQAETVYGLVVDRHPGSAAGYVATLRLANLGQDLAQEDPQEASTVDLVGSLKPGPRAPRTAEAQAEAFRTVSEAQRHNEVGSEALFLLADHHVRQGRPAEAKTLLQQLCDREGRVVGDVWPARARQQLSQLLHPEMAAAIRMADDFQMVQLYHRFGSCPDWRGGHVDVLFQIAEAHRRLGFVEPAILLYQQVLRDPQAQGVREQTILGLGRAYLDQRDGIAARRMFERYQLEFPLGTLKPDALRYLSESWALLGDAASVIKVCQRWFKARGPQAAQDPGYGQILLRLVAAYAAAGQPAEAIKTLRLAEQAGVMPYIEARLKEGHYLEARGSGRAAIAQWAEVVRSEPASPEALRARIEMARVWWLQQRLPEAGVVLSRVSGDGSGDVFTRAALVMKSAAAVQAKILKETKP